MPSGATVKRCRHKNRWRIEPWTSKHLEGTACLKVSSHFVKKQATCYVSTSAVEWCEDCGSIRYPANDKERWTSSKGKKS